MNRVPLVPGANKANHTVCAPKRVRGASRPSEVRGIRQSRKRNTKGAHGLHFPVVPQYRGSEQRERRLLDRWTAVPVTSVPFDCLGWVSQELRNAPPSATQCGGNHYLVVTVNEEFDRKSLTEVIGG